MTLSQDELDRYFNDIISAATKVHMNLTGACDDLTSDEVFELVSTIKRKLAGWKSSQGRWWHKYDECVKHLLERVIQEYEAERVR